MIKYLIILLFSCSLMNAQDLIINPYAYIYQPAVFDENLLGWWPFDYNTEDTLNNYTSTPFSITYSTFLNEKVAVFDGNGYVLTDYNGTELDTFTITTWVKDELATSYRYIFDNSPGSVGYGVRHTVNGNEINGLIYDDGGAKTTPTLTIPDNNWHFISFVVGSNDTAYLMVDTTIIGNVVINSANGIVDSDSTLRIGATTSNNLPFVGNMNDFKIYDKPFTVDELLVKFNEEQLSYIEPLEVNISTPADFLIGDSAQLIADVNQPYDSLRYSTSMTGTLTNPTNDTAYFKPDAFQSEYILVTAYNGASTAVDSVATPALTDIVYVSNSGNDASYGNVIGSPIQTLSRLDEITPFLVDTFEIYFARNDTFYGQFSIADKSGTSVISSYGSGSFPVLAGYETLTSWTDVGGGIYSSPTTANDTFTIVSIDGVNAEIARTDTLYYNDRTISSITDVDLPASPSYTGAEVVVNSADWVLNRKEITSHVGNTLNVDGDFYLGTPWPDRYYFIQNDYSLLDSDGEWYCNSDSGKLYVYYSSGTPADHDIRISLYDNIIDLTNTDYCNISDIKISGAYHRGFAINNTSTYYVLDSVNVDFSYIGLYNDGLYDTIKNCNLSQIYNIAIDNQYNPNKYVSYNTIQDVARTPGLINYPYSTEGAWSGHGIFSYGTNSYVGYNTIRRIGYVGSSIRGSNSTFEFNYVDSACIVKTDGGGIYMNNETYTNRTVSRNLITNSGANGIYLDENAANVLVDSNFVTNSTKYGLQLHKAGSNTITDNTFVNSYYAWWFQNNTTSTYNDVDSNYMHENIMVSDTSAERFLYSIMGTNSITNHGDIDSNYYIREDAIDEMWRYSYDNYTQNGTVDLAGWQAFGYDANSSYVQDTVEIHTNKSLSDSTIYFSGYTKTDAKGSTYTDSLVMAPRSGVVITETNNDSLFAFTINTALDTGDDFTLPLRSGYSYDFTVYWGDGNSSEITAYDDADITHTYSSGGTYQIEIDGTCEAWAFDNGGDKLKIVSVDSWGLTGLKNMQGAFFGCVNLATLPTSYNYNWSSLVTTMGVMFHTCTSLTTIDVSSWDVSSVTNMSYMFNSCTSLTTIDVSSWDVSSVTNMSVMFYNCTSLTTIDVSSWDVSSVTNMANMLTNVPITTSVYDAALIYWSGLSLKSGVTLDANLAEYTSGGAAETARTYITTTFSWAINDGGGI